jgi:hypothetical protein
MIPDNIKKSHVIEAIKLISKEGRPRERQAAKYHLHYEGENFPPKYVLSVANRFANGRDLAASEFSGGKEANGFLERLGFEIRPASTPTEGNAQPPKRTGEKKTGEDKDITGSVE